MMTRGIDTYETESDMIADLRQEPFTHAKCFNCGHVGKIESFNPRLVDIEESNNPYVKITMDEGSKGMLQTIDHNCPVCNSANVEALYASEIN